MGAPLSADLRDRIFRGRHDDGMTYVELAARFSVGVASVNRLLRRHRETGELLPKPHCSGNPPKVDAEGAALLRRLVAEKSDATLAELSAQYMEYRKTKLSNSMLFRALDKLGLTRKKRRCTPRSAKRTA